MDERPLTFVVRLWSRQEEFRAEVKLLQGGKTLYFKSSAELLAFLEQPQLATDDGVDA
ncbi:MAG: hypothetical protein KC422_24625 [Trueperaceae bacterium]|nr:hypothetical protein [Trueperaceae bacterium]